VGPPTAIQNRAERQDTPRSPLKRGNVGWRWLAQWAPSQRSISVQRFRELVLPTATQKLVEMHDTAFSMLPTPLTALPVAGVGWVVHLAPSQRAASVASESRSNPTPIQNRLDTQDTPSRPREEVLW